MRSFILIFSLLVFSGFANAITLKAEARAPSEQQARREALAALADSIFVNVKSEYESRTTGDGKSQQEMHISSSSDIPLIGVEVTAIATGRDVVCEARLDSNKSLSLYTKKLNELLLEIGTLDQRIARATDNDRYMLLTQAVTILEQYEKYRAVAQLLGSERFSAPPRSLSDTEEQLRAFEKSTPSIELAAKLLAKALKVEALYISPAVPHGSHEVTPFGRVMRDRLAQIMPSVESPENAKNFFKGEYEILDNGIHLTYRLLDSSGNTLATRLATLAPSAYKSLQVKPSTVDFDRLLHEGIAVSSDFRAQLTTNRGNEGVLFEEKDEVDLMVKLSRPGYFYVVGHVVKKGDNSSYLLELSHADSDRRFIRFVNADDVNKWLNIGRFDVTPPFGVESLQLIASSEDPINNLPNHFLDKNTEMYVTADDAKQGIAKTRSLKPKRTEADKQYQAETVLMFTTMAKGRQ